MTEETATIDNTVIANVNAILAEKAINGEPAPSAKPDPQVHIHRKTFERIEGLRKRVAETTVTLDRAAREKKEAQEAFNSATMNLSAAVSDMLDEVNGVPKLPLFDNQTDAITRAEADPIAQKLLSRMLDHGVSHLNQLVVAGYNEAQQNELAAYLDALDARKKAESEGVAELPELLDMPAFLVPEPRADVTQDEINALVGALANEGLTLKPEHVSALTNTQWIEAEEWIGACARVKTEKGDALVMDDLPPAPSYLVNPAEVLPEPEPRPEPVTILDEPEKKARAPRRSSATFKNSPKIVKAKKSKH